MAREVQIVSSSLWREPNFIKLWVGQTVSNLGSGITGAALPLTAVLFLGASPGRMGLLSAFGSAPVLLAGLFVGVWVDRVRRRPLLIAADVGRAILLGSIPLAALLGRLRIEQLYIVAALGGTLTLVFRIAHQSFLPSVVSRQQLGEGNAKLGVSDAIAEIGGNSLGGLLVQAVTAPLAIVVDALSFLVSAGCIGLIRVAEPMASDRPADQSVWADIRGGLSVILRHPLLRAVTASSSTRNFFGWFIGALYTIYVVEQLGVGPAMYGALVGAGGVSSLVGALLVERLNRRYGLGRTLIGAFLFSGATTALIPLAGAFPTLSLPLLFGGQLIGDAALTIYFISELTLRQALTPDRLLGRVNASAHVLVNGIGPVGALVAGVLAEVIGIRATLSIAVVGILGASGWMLASPLRHLNAHGPGDDATVRASGDEASP